MDLTNQKVIGTNEVHLLDSLNAALLSAKISRNGEEGVPNSNDLTIFVDTAEMSTPTSERSEERRVGKEC